MARNDDDSPRKKRRSDEDEDDDDRPRQKKRPRDDDEDDEDEEPRAKKRRPRDDDDEEVERAPKKKKKKPGPPMPAMLIVMAVLALVWGGLCLLGGCGQFFVASQHMIFNFAGLPGGLKALALLTLLVSFVNALMACAVVGGGILLLCRRAIGRNLVVGGPLGMALCVVAYVVIIGITLGGAFGVMWPFLLGGIIGVGIHLGVSAIFMKLQENPEVSRALR